MRNDLMPKRVFGDTTGNQADAAALVEHCAEAIFALNSFDEVLPMELPAARHTLHPAFVLIQSILCALKSYGSD